MLEVIRLVYSEPESAKRGLNTRQALLRSYFLTLRQFEEVTVGKPAANQISLKMAQSRRDRGRLQDLLEVMGLRLGGTGKDYVIERNPDRKAGERRQLLTAAGVNVEAIERTLSEGGTVDVVLPTEAVPLLLPAAAWGSGVLGKGVPARSLAGAILTDRDAALLYYGLAALDSQTLAYLAANTDVVKMLREKDSGSFAASGRSLHVRDGKVMTPGPPAATTLWESLVGERVDRPKEFISNLFGKDAGRLAFFFDAVAHLTEAGQRYALGSLINGQREQDDQLRALYEAFGTGIRTWVPAVRPFVRAAYDGAQLLSAVRVTDKGELAAPAWTRLWTALFQGPGVIDETMQLPEAGDFYGTLSAAALVGLTTAVDVNTRRERSETILFAQRVFGSVEARNAPDVLVALGGFARYRGLLLTLERMGLTDPALMARSVRCAAQVSRAAEAPGAAALLGEFQGALAIVERARFARAIDVKTARDLVEALLELEPVVPGQYGRQVARWIDARLLPALGRAPGGPLNGVTSERAVLVAMAGAVSNGQPGSAGGLDQVIRFEDQDYVVDLATADLTRFELLREAQPSNDLDAVLELARTTETLSAGVSNVPELQAGLESLRAIAPRLRPPARVGTRESEPAPDPRIAIGRVLKDAATIGNEKDLGRVPQIVAPLAESLDPLLSEVLATLAYVASLGDPEGVALLAGNLAAEHDFGFGEVRLTLRPRLPWAVPMEVSGPGVTWHLAGSLLGLDAAMSQLALRQLVEEHVPPVPALDMNERATLSQAIVLTNPRDLSEADLSAIVEAVGASRRRLGTTWRDASELEAWLEKAGVDEWRVRAIRWMIVHEPNEVPGMLTLTDLFWLSADTNREARSLSAFGTAPPSLSAGLLTQFPAPESWGTAIGREGAGFLSSRFDDLKLRIAEALAEEKLPIALLPAVLAVATTDFIGDAAPVHRDDYVTMSRQAQQIPLSRINAYIASLAASGPLVPVNRRKAREGHQ